MGTITVQSAKVVRIIDAATVSRGHTAEAGRRSPTTSLTTSPYFDRSRNMKSISPLPLARLEATEEHVEALKALAHLSRLQIFFLLVRAKGELSVGEIQA